MSKYCRYNVRLVVEGAVCKLQQGNDEKLWKIMLLSCRPSVHQNEKQCVIFYGISLFSSVNLD
jgi:hypothetical protein